MSDTLDLRNSPPKLPDDLVASLARQAEDMAELTARFLDAMGFLPPRSQRLRQPVALPAEFLLELAAVLRLRQWEHAGLRASLDTALPTAEQALRDVLSRALAAPESFDRDPSRFPPLLHQILDLVSHRLAWSGRAELNADIVLADIDGEVLLEALADWLWTHRHAALPED